MAKSHGLILDLLDTLSRPGNAVKDLLSGNVEGALRQVGQIPIDAYDSIAPTFLQPDDLVRPEDEVSGRDLIGAPDNWWGHAAGFGVDVLTDPLTYFGGPIFKGIGKGASAIGEAALSGADRLLPGTADAVTGATDKAGRWLRDLTAQQRADHPELWNALDRLRGQSSTAGQAGIEAAKKALGGLDARQRKIIGDAIDNVRFGPDGKPIGELVPSGVDPATGVSFGGIGERIKDHPDLVPGEEQALTDAANQALEIGRNQKSTPGIFDANSQANLPDEYLMRQYKGLEKDPLDELLGKAGETSTSPMKERVNSDWRDISRTLTENPKAEYVRDALERLITRSSKHGDLFKKAGVGQSVMDLMRQGKIAVPEDAIVDEAGKLRGAAKGAPVPESGASADVNAMMGGEPVAPAAVDPYGTELGAGKAKFSQQADISAMMGGPKTAAADVSEDIGAANKAITGEQSGRAVVGESTAQTPSLKYADLKPEEIEAATNNILGKDFALSDPSSKNLVKMAIAGMVKESPETAKLAMDALNGLAPRNEFWKALARSNAWFKKFASYGIVLPKVGKMFRNRLNGPMQAFANDATRGATLDMLKTLPSDLTGSVMDAIGKPGADALSGTLEHWEEALANSAGDPKKAVAAMAEKYPKEAAFIGAGGMDGFVRGDELIKEASQPGWMQKLKTIADFPARLNRGIEDRMRLRLGVAQVEKYLAEGKSLPQAAEMAVKDTGDSLYRYSANSKNSRMLKDLIPYVSWTTQSVPAEAKMMIAHPWYASMVEHAMHRDPKSAPIDPYLEDQAAYDIGEDSTGNRHVLAGLGYPFETLAEIPNPFAPIGQFGRQIEKDVVGQAAPLLKTAYGVVSGRDPNFGTPFGSYDRMPIVGDAGDVGGLYNMAQSTGLLSPVDTPLRVIDQLIDDRKDAGTKALGMLTGANIATVDPERAKAQQLKEELDRDPRVNVISQMTSKDPDAKELISELLDVQRKLKEKRKAASTGP